MKWVVCFTAMIIIIVLILRIWRYQDDRELALTWQRLVATAIDTPKRFDSTQLACIIHEDSAARGNLAKQVS